MLQSCECEPVLQTLPVLQTEVLQLLWLSGHVAALSSFIIISVFDLVFCLYQHTDSDLPVWMDPPSHSSSDSFSAARNLLMKVLFTFLTPNWTFAHSPGWCAGASLQVLCVLAFVWWDLSLTPLASCVIRYIIWWHKSSWCPYSSCHTVQMCRLGSLRLFFFSRITCD